MDPKCSSLTNCYSDFDCTRDNQDELCALWAEEDSLGKMAIVNYSCVL